MTQQPLSKLQYVEDYWACERRKDLDRVLDHFCEDAEFVSPTMQLKGREEVARFYRGMIGGFREIEVTPVNHLESGDSIAVNMTAAWWQQRRGAAGTRIQPVRVPKGTVSAAALLFQPGGLLIGTGCLQRIEFHERDDLDRLVIGFPGRRHPGLPLYPMKFMKNCRWENGWFWFSLVCCLLLPAVLAFGTTPGLLQIYCTAGWSTLDWCSSAAWAGVWG